MKTLVKIGADPMPAAAWARFLALFPVARAHSTVGWTWVRACEAEVLVCHRRPRRGLQSASVCIEPLWAADRLDADVMPLDARFGVLSLVAALDRAAVVARRVRDERPPVRRRDLVAMEEWLSELWEDGVLDEACPAVAP